MSDSSFVHLHVHTQYSLLQGANRVSTLLDKAKEYEMPALAITDSNNLFGSVDFYFAAQSRGIKPIIGCEIYYAPDGRAAITPTGPARGLSSQNFKPNSHHLVLLCKNIQGYRNLCQILTQAYVDQPPAKKGASAPGALVDRPLLEKYKEGLVVLSGGLKGELSYKILTGKKDDAVDSVSWFQERFKEDFYFELQDSSIPEQDHVNEVLYQLGKERGIECVATTDCHYLTPDDAEAQEILQCIEMGRNLDIDRPASLVPSEYYFKDAAKMRERFEAYEGACDNTLKIAEKCDLEFKFKDEQGNPIYHLPNFRPEGVSKEDTSFSAEDYFREQAKKGLEERFTEKVFEDKVQQPNWEELKKEYYERLEVETEMIVRTGFAGYFLIVADFIIWAKKNDIPVGPGRGSGAGSLVAYSLKITDIDPIAFNLLFERFINPERISMPDFDVDFCQDRRGEVIEYVSEKYGKENVCQIITFGKLQARAVVKDVGRVLGLTFAETDQLTKLFPDELNISLSKAFDKEPRLRERIDADSKLKKVWDYALKLEGLYRNAGVHAAGVIITEKPVVNYCPLYVGSEGAPVTQLDKDFSERIGLVKFDFLGLKTLTVIDNAVKFIRKSAVPGTYEETFTIDQINYDDKGVFDLIGSGDTDGVFQVESSGMKDLCSRLQPNSVEDLTAINALYRPGPLGSGMVDDFIDRKHGRQAIEYELDALEPILKDTYGVILYQEQVMQIARELAGYSLGQADMLRRAMGKKKAEEMDRHREIFLKGAKERDIPEAKAAAIYELMAKFAEYGFNKSHSAAYAVLTYQTAFLKNYYPAEFMAALMATEINNTDKLSKYIVDARNHKIAVLSPDVNLSQKQFSVEKIGKDSPDFPHPKDSEIEEVKAVRFGLEAIKGVGGIAVDAIIEARQVTEDEEGNKVGGPFEDLLDFGRKVSIRKVNKKVMEALTLSGAFDSISQFNRPTVLNSIEKVLEFASDEQEERDLGQASLFDSFSAEEIKLVTPTDSIFTPVSDWPKSKRLLEEKKVVGFFVSGHPMDGWQKICSDWLGWSTERIKAHAEEVAQKAAKTSSDGFDSGGRYVYQRPQRKEIQVAGLLSESKEIITKKGSRMAFVQLEDLEGKLELIFFPEAFQNLQDRLHQALAEAEAVIVGGELEVKEEVPKIFVKTLEWAEEAHQGRAKQVVLKLDPLRVNVEQLRALKKSFLQNRGKCPVRIEFKNPKFETRLQLPQNLRVEGTPALVASINRIFGESVVELK